MPLLPPLVPTALSSSSQTRLDGWLVSDNAKKISSKKNYRGKMFQRQAKGLSLDFTN